MTSTAKSILADVNVWLAMLVAEHSHHDAASLWWRTTVIPDRHRVAFCRLTQLGLLRLLCSERVMGPSRMNHAQAWEAVRAVVAQEHVSVQDEPAGVERPLAGFVCDAAHRPASGQTRISLRLRLPEGIVSQRSIADSADSRDSISSS